MKIFQGEEPFTSPKPTRLIQRILEIATSPLDEGHSARFFAGSGSTAHAVLKQNALDKGNRRFIVVQQQFDTKNDEQNSSNICETVTAKRIRRVITGYPYKGTAREVLFSMRLTPTRLLDLEGLASKVKTLVADAQTRFNQIELRAMMERSV